MSKNDEVAQRFEEMADLLEAKDVDFKPRAYRRAAERIRDIGRPIEVIAGDGVEALTKFDDIGDAIASKIVEYLEEGRIEELEELKAEIPVDMDALLRVEGLGPKRIGTLYRSLGITDLEDLEAAAKAGDIQTVDGFGQKTETNILERIPFAKAAAKRHLLVDGMEAAEEIVAELSDDPSVIRCSIAGSIRRWRPTVGDVDLLVATESPTSVIETIEVSEAVETVLESGEQKARVRSPDGVSMDFRFVEASSFGAALQYFTGSQAHNVQLRRRAIDRDLTVNEYGVFTDDGTNVASETESAVYDAVDLPLIEPELREGRGEIEAAAAGALPDLIDVDDIRGDLHVHTTWSDGTVDIETMVEAAADIGHDFVAITDHAPGAGVRSDITVDIEDVYAQREAVMTVRSDATIRVFHGLEANIEPDGGIDLPDDLLQELDIVIASPHAALGQDTETATERLIAAIEHPQVDIIGHPTGRKLGQRPGLELDVEAIVQAAAVNDVALEVNSHPVRLDLEGGPVKRAVDAGVPVAINTDAHRPEELSLQRFGVHTARRGWAEASDCLNTLSPSRLDSWLE